MERSTVHIAVLVVAEDPASVDLANATFMSDKALAAGHRIVAQEIVEDDEAAIRDQLARWIGQPHIDVIFSAGADDATAVALGPLVTKPLPGLTDQLRLLARDRGSAARPVAARCASKFVFLLPPEIAALGPALNQLVMPQLDSTAERNLVKDMPRHGGEAIPQTVAAEKTVTGAGVAPKIPAEPRNKRKTGANIVARNEARQAVISAQDATRQIDREKLERHLARSSNPSHDAPTRPHIDLATMLPPVPPGASDRADTEEELPALDPSTLDDPTLENPTAPAVRTVQPARLRGSAPIGTAKAPSKPPPIADEAPPARAQTRPADEAPTTRAQTRPTDEAPTTRAQTKPAASAPFAAKPLAIPTIAARPSGPPPAAKELPKPTPVSGVTTATPASGNRMPTSPAATPAAGVAAAAPATSKPAAGATAAATSKPASGAAAAATSKPASGAAAAAASKPASGAAATTTTKPTNGQSRAAHASPARIGEVRRAELEAEAADETLDAASPADIIEAASSADIIEAASSADILEAASADFDEVSTPPTPSRMQAAPMIPSARPSASTPPAIPQRPATGSAPVVPQRPATGPAAVVPQRPATGPAPIVATSAAPPQPFTGPELLDLREGTQKKRRSRTGTALVREGKKSSALMYLALAGAAVAGFFAVVHFFPQFVGKDDEAPAKGSAVVAMQPAGSETVPPSGSSAAGSATAEPSGAAATEPAVPPTTEPVGSAETAVGSGARDGSSAAAVASTVATHPASGHPAAHHGAASSGAAVTHPEATTAKTETAKTETAKSDVAKTETPAPPPAEDGCDEVSCVMDHYEKACCARFKPADGGFHPKGSVPDQLDRSMVKAGIEKVKPKVEACGEKISAKGTVKLAVTVAPGGTVQDISVVEAPDGALGACVMAAVKRAQFGKATNSTSFNYPFVF